MNGGITSYNIGTIVRKIGYDLKTRYDLQFDFKAVNKMGLNVPKRRTLKQLLAILEKEYPDKAFLVSVTNHVIGVKNKTIMDTDRSGDNLKVQMIEEVIK